MIKEYLSKFFAVNKKAEQCHADAKAAMDAYFEHSNDRAKGVYRVVDTNLERVQRRKANEARKTIESFGEDL